MGFWDSIKESTEKATSSISEVASSTSKVVVEKMSEAGSVVAETATKTGQAVSDAASATVEKVTSWSSSVYDSMCELAAKNIKSMLRGVDLQSVIDNLNKIHDEKGTEVSPLVNFVNQLKTFSEDGNE